MCCTLQLQEILSHMEQQQILTMYQHLPDVSDAIATLDIAIGFLVSVGGKPDMAIDEFLSKQLHMEERLAQSTQKCQLRHVKVYIKMCESY